MTTALIAREVAITVQADQTIERMKRELWSDLKDLVESCDLTDIEAMEWFNMKCDQWVQGAA